MLFKKKMFDYVIFELLNNFKKYKNIHLLWSYYYYADLKKIQKARLYGLHGTFIHANITMQKLGKALMYNYEQQYEYIKILDDLRSRKIYFTSEAADQCALYNRLEGIYYIYKYGIRCTSNGLELALKCLNTKYSDSYSNHRYWCIIFEILKNSNIDIYNSLYSELHHNMILERQTNLNNNDIICNILKICSNGFANEIASNGDLEILRELHSYGIDCSSDILQIVLPQERFDLFSNSIIFELISYGFYFISADANIAAKFGEEDIVIILHEHGIDCTYEGINIVVKNGNLNLFLQLKEFGIQCTTDAIALAMLYETQYSYNNIKCNYEHDELISELITQFCFTFLLGIHNRCGHNSSLQSLSSDLIPEIIKWILPISI